MHYLLVPTASISSMKTIEGECSSATRNNSRTNFGPSPCRRRKKELIEMNTAPSWDFYKFFCDLD